MFVKPIISDSDFYEVQSEWITFEGKVDNKNITTSYEWQRTWWKHFKDYENKEFGYNKKLCILFLYNDENILRAIAPFCEITRIKSGLKYKTIEFLAQQWGANYLDIITDKLTEDEFSFLFSWLETNKKYDVLELKYIPVFTQNFKINTDCLTVMSACPEMDFKNYLDAEEYRQNVYSKNLKKKLRKAVNRLEKDNIKYRERIIDIKDIDINSIKAVSRSKLLDDKHCIYDEPEKEKFLKDIYYNPVFKTNIATILFDDKFVSYRINLFYNNYKYCFDASFDREYHYYELGPLTIDLNVGDTFEKKISVYCKCTGIDPYKLKFANKINRIYTFLQKGNTVKGLFWYLAKKNYNRKIAEEFEKTLEENLQKG